MDQEFRKKILLSEDINRTLDRTDCYLHRSAFLVRSARTGREILDLAEIERPDVVFINYALPDLKGDEVCRVLKRPAAGDPGPAVLILGPPQPVRIAEGCRVAGCDDYVATPAPANLILRRLAGALRLHFRLHARVPAVLSISFGRIISEFLGYSRDISEGGILVESRLKADPGRRLHLRLFLGQDPVPLVTRATVLRSEPAPEEDQYLLGMQFLKMDPASTSRLKGYIESQSGR